MLLPWYVAPRNAHVFLKELADFDGIVFISPYHAGNETPNQRFSEEMRQEIMHRLPRNVESDYHIWIGTERHGTMHSFLHAQVLSNQEALVDLLCAFKWAYNWQTKSYEGFGELGALFMWLEQRGVGRLSFPFALNMRCGGLRGAAWFEQGQGIYQKKAERQ